MTKTPRLSSIRVILAVIVAPFLPGIVASCLGTLHLAILMRPELAATPLGRIGHEWLSLPLTDPVAAIGPGLLLAATHVISRPRLTLILLGSAAAGAIGFATVHATVLGQSTFYAAFARNVLFSVMVGASAWWIVFHRPAAIQPRPSEWRVAVAVLIVPLVPGPTVWLMTIMLGKKSWMPASLMLSQFLEFSTAQLMFTIPSAIVALVIVIALRTLLWNGASAFIAAGFLAGVAMALLLTGRRATETSALNFIFLFASLGALSMAVGWLITSARWPLSTRSQTDKSLPTAAAR